MKYRPEIDGLRALAVVPVILFHAGIEVFSGGFIGVDVFFVISGYLITSILIDEIDRGDFSIAKFYERRARRILPALFFVIVCTLPFAWAWMLPDQIKVYSGSVFSVPVFISNLYFLSQIHYFAPKAELQPLLHTWSLGIEEQYYLFFPLLLVALAKRGTKRTVFVISTLLLLSLAFSEWASRENPERNFFFSLGRFWELFAGSISAFFVRKHGVQRNEGLALVGLGAIIASIFLFDSSIPFPSAFALVPVLGVVLLVLFAEKQTLVARILSYKPIVGIGLISYSAYLWHQPLFAFARIKLLTPPSDLVMLGLAAAALGMAFLSWKYVEAPFRKRDVIAQKTLVLSASLTSMLLICIGIFGFIFQLEIFRATKSTEQFDAYQFLEKARLGSSIYLSENYYNDRKCKFSVTNLTPSVAERLENCFQTFGSGILVVGDSHATNLYHSLAENSANSLQQFLVGITKNGCHLPTDKAGCQYIEVLDFLKENPTAFNNIIYEKAGYLMIERSQEELRFTSSKQDAAFKSDVVSGVGAYLDELGAFSRITWFGPRLPPLVFPKEYLQNGCAHAYTPSQQHVSAYANLDTFLQSFSESKGWHYVSQQAMFDFNYPSDFGDCERLLWADGTHYSKTGEAHFGSRNTLLDLLE